ncbi:hypothetical protein GBF38_015872, partial [Nibea albiflora]
MILLHNVEPFTSANSRQLFVSVFFTVGGGDDLIFGSGTKLLVTAGSEARGERVPSSIQSPPGGEELPAVSGQPCFLLWSSSPGKDKRRTVIEEVHHDVGDPEKLKESGCTASILLIHQHESSTYKYRGSVQHEGGTVEAQTEQ